MSSSLFRSGHQSIFSSGSDDAVGSAYTLSEITNGFPFKKTKNIPMTKQSQQVDKATTSMGDRSDIFGVAVKLLSSVVKILGKISLLKSVD